MGGDRFFFKKRAFIGGRGKSCVLCCDKGKGAMGVGREGLSEECSVIGHVYFEDVWPHFLPPLAPLSLENSLELIFKFCSLLD